MFTFYTVISYFSGWWSTGTARERSQLKKKSTANIPCGNLRSPAQSDYEDRAIPDYSEINKVTLLISLKTFGYLIHLFWSLIIKTCINILWCFYFWDLEVKKNSTYYRKHLNMIAQNFEYSITHLQNTSMSEFNFIIQIMECIAYQVKYRSFLTLLLRLGLLNITLKWRIFYWALTSQDQSKSNLKQNPEGHCEYQDLSTNYFPVLIYHYTIVLANEDIAGNCTLIAAK